METNDDLPAALSRAVSLSLQEILRARPLEHLSGYALCTDDDVMTVFHVACTREFCAKSRIQDIEFNPVEWSYDEGRGLFDDAVRMVQRRYAMSGEGASFSKHVSNTFGCFVEALRECRARQLVGDDVLLIVTSTDPGPAMERRAIEAAKELNNPALFESWKEAMGY